MPGEHTPQHKAEDSHQHHFYCGDAQHVPPCLPEQGLQPADIKSKLDAAKDRAFNVNIVGDIKTLIGHGRGHIRIRGKGAGQILRLPFLR